MIKIHKKTKDLSPSSSTRVSLFTPTAYDKSKYDHSPSSSSVNVSVTPASSSTSFSSFSSDLRDAKQVTKTRFRASNAQCVHWTKWSNEMVTLITEFLSQHLEEKEIYTSVLKSYNKELYKTLNNPDSPLLFPTNSHQIILFHKDINRKLNIKQALSLSSSDFDSLQSSLKQPTTVFSAPVAVPTPIILFTPPQLDLPQLPPEPTPLPLPTETLTKPKNNEGKIDMPH